MGVLFKKNGLNNKTALTIGLTLVVVLALANIWFIYSLFFSADSSDPLPRLSLNPFSATSLVFSDNQQSKWQKPRTILIMGRPGSGHIAPNLTDTIMLLHIAPPATEERHTDKKPTVSLVSLPRDLLVPATTKNQNKQVLKVNALWLYSKHLYDEKIIDDRATFVQERIGEISGLDIDGFVLFDLATVETVVKKVDGVTVSVDEDIYDPTFPVAPGVTETFELPAGKRYLDGESALRFVRTRYSPRGDFDRIARQQELLRAIKGKMVSFSPVWDFPTLWSLFKTVRDNLVTTLSADDVQSLWQLGQDVSIDDIAILSITPDTADLSAKMITLGNSPAYVLSPTGDDPFDYASIQETIQAFIHK